MRYEIFRRGGELDGVRVMWPDSIAAVLVPQSRIEPDLMLGMNFGFGYGPMLGGLVFSRFGPDTTRAFGISASPAAWSGPTSSACGRAHQRQTDSVPK
ncbi:hypothetical protein ACQP1G_10735 [Nocardia sp. CA-107356]|uniref:hypothetical protein n=1 Tax=Nocardia sp. CA-107356 TaxID=3239972 RepID=UPI003D8E1F22